LSSSEEGGGDKEEEIVMHVLLTLLLIALFLPKYFPTVGGCRNLGFSNLFVVQTKIIVHRPLLHVFHSVSVWKLSHRYNNSIIFQFLSCHAV
jgi:hypothetical protein